MRPEASKLLGDIRDAGGFILQIHQGATLTQYRENRILRNATERNFEIIGEAINRLVRADPDTSALLGEVRVIIAFRNILAHGYDYIDHEIVFDVIQTKLPVLLTRVDELLKNPD